MTKELEFYRREIAPMLPPKVLDFHTHVWTSKSWNVAPWESGKKGGNYMVTTPEYPPTALLADGKRAFPDREYHAVCFGYPVPVTNWEKDTAYVAKAAIRSIRDLPNVMLDASMVMDPICFQLVLNTIGPGRLLYATDFPVANMRGRRVSVMDHWVDVVLPGYPASAFRVAGDIRATFMATEIALALRWAAELTGLKRKEIHGIFWDNGMRLLRRVRRV